MGRWRLKKNIFREFFIRFINSSFDSPCM